MVEPDSELARALNKRRTRVDELGKQFTKSPVKGNAADVTWEEHTEDQFTPRSFRQRAEKVAAVAAAAPEEAVQAGAEDQAEVEDAHEAKATPARVEARAEAEDVLPEVEVESTVPAALGVESPATATASEASAPAAAPTAAPPVTTAGVALKEDALPCVESQGGDPLRNDADVPAAAVQTGGATAAPEQTGRGSRGMRVAAGGRRLAARSGRDGAAAAPLPCKGEVTLPRRDVSPGKPAPPPVRVVRSGFALPDSGLSPKAGFAVTSVPASSLGGVDLGTATGQVTSPESASTTSSPAVGLADAVALPSTPSDAAAVASPGVASPGSEALVKPSWAQASSPAGRQASTAPPPPTPEGALDQSILLERVLDAHGSKSPIWHAIVQGDVTTLQALVAQGSLTSGRLLDDNGHSVLWNAVAFQQAEVALWLIRQFPPDASAGNGVDLSEVHARRGDSLFHLCLYFTDFTVQAAEVFRAIFLGSLASSGSPYKVSNRNGQNFLHVAATRLNFWVFHFALANAPECAVLFQCKDSDGRAPADILLRRAEEVTGGLPLRPCSQPAMPRAPIPAWSPFARHAPAGCKTGSDTPPPFSDITLEVEDRGAKGGVVRASAHRVVLAANSRAFDGMLRKLAPGESLRLDPLCCRSASVLDAVLGFLYSGELRECSFATDGFLLWQLLCLCTQYSLPAPLSRYARLSLLRVLGERKHASVVPVLLQAVEHVGLTLEESMMVACTLLMNIGAELAGDLLVSADGTESLLAALVEVERYVLNPWQPGSPGSAVRAPMQPQSPAPSF